MIGFVSALAFNLAIAQPNVTFEFESMFGQFGFYTTTQPPNQIPPAGFSTPTGIDWLRSNQLIIADRGNRKLQVCTDLGECQWRSGDAQGGQMFVYRNVPGTFDLPHGIEVSSPSLLAVADEENHAVQVCDEIGNCVYIGEEFSANNPPSPTLGNWAFPQDVAFHSSGDVFGLDTGNSRIQRLRSIDWLVSRVYQLPVGSGPGQFINARGIAIDDDDRVIISDTGNHRIQICEIVSNLLECFVLGRQGSAPGRFESPVGVDVDKLGRIWVADTGNHRIQACDYDGDCVAYGGLVELVSEAQSPNEVEDWTIGPGLFNKPHDVAWHPSGRLAVVDTNNHRIQLFKTESSFSVNAGMNDAWFNPATPGQGFFMTVLPLLQVVFLAHFTFDTQTADGDVRTFEGEGGQRTEAIIGAADQRWVTAFGPFSGDTAVLNVELSSGGVFDSAEPPVVQQQDYGTYNVTFSDCMNGTIRYEFPDLGLAGEIPITRVAPDNAALCEALNSQ